MHVRQLHLKQRRGCRPGGWRPHPRSYYQVVEMGQHVCVASKTCVCTPSCTHRVHIVYTSCTPLVNFLCEHVAHIPRCPSTPTPSPRNRQHTRQLHAYVVYAILFNFYTISPRGPQRDGATP